MVLFRLVSGWLIIVLQQYYFVLYIIYDYIVYISVIDMIYIYIYISHVSLYKSYLYIYDMFSSKFNMSISTSVFTINFQYQFQVR